MTKQRAQSLQKGINAHLKRNGFPWLHLKVDGDPGAATHRLGTFALFCMGASDSQRDKFKGGTVTDHAFKLLTGKEQLSDAMKKRRDERKPMLKQMRQDHKQAQESSIPGTALFSDSIQTTPVRVASWMVGKSVGPDGTKTNWLKVARENGWTGVVTSGYRTPEYSESLCYAMCNQPSCPGRCAGKSSNHSQTMLNGGNGGAIDVSDYVTFGNIMRAKGAPLQNQLGSADPVHYSPSGH